MGYKIDGETKYVSHFKDKLNLGLFNATFNVRTFGSFKCITNCKGYSLKKNVWNEIIDSNDTYYHEIKDYLKNWIKVDFYHSIFKHI